MLLLEFVFYYKNSYDHLDGYYRTTNDRKTFLAQFADDTALLAYSHSTPAVIEKLQNAANKLCRYFKPWRVRVNGPKSEAILFTRKRANRHRPRSCVSVAGVDVEWGQVIKYLGLILDPKLTFSRHVDSIIVKTDKMIKCLYPLINRGSKLCHSNKILLYKSLFRPTISYASQIWVYSLLFLLV